MANKTDSPTLDQLFAEAFAEDEAVEQAVEPAPEPIVEEGGEEQSEEVAVPAKLSDLFEQGGEEPPSTAPTVDLALEVTLPDGSKATIRELLDGNMMRKDYTQKTQKLAAANELYTMLQDDPEGTVAALAEKLGLALADDFTFNQTRNKKDVSKLITSDEDKIAAIVEAKAKQILEQYRKEDPVMQEMETRAAQAKVQRELDRIEKTYSTPLDEADRNALIGLAIKYNEPNLEYIYLKARAELDAKRAEIERVNAGKVRKTVATPLPTKADALKVKPKTIEESFALAELQLANK